VTIEILLQNRALLGHFPLEPLLGFVLNLLADRRLPSFRLLQLLLHAIPFGDDARHALVRLRLLVRRRSALRGLEFLLEFLLKLLAHRRLSLREPLPLLLADLRLDLDEPRARDQAAAPRTPVCHRGLHTRFSLYVPAVHSSRASGLA